MSFGFPAYHESPITDIPAGTDVRLSIWNTLGNLGWNPSDQGGSFMASTSFNMSSWGERISVKFLTDGTPIIRSECAMPTQCIDWGKNKRNVEKFFQELPKYFTVAQNLSE